MDYDVNNKRISDLSKCIDSSLDVAVKENFACNFSVFDPYLATDMISNFIVDPFMEMINMMQLLSLSLIKFIKYRTDDFLDISKEKLVLLNLKNVCNNAVCKF